MYKRFSENICEDGFLKFGDDAKDQMYCWETYGRKKYYEKYNSEIDPLNGYYHGKRLFDITLTAWIEDIKAGMLSFPEIEEDFGPEMVVLLKRKIPPPNK